MTLIPFRLQTLRKGFQLRKAIGIRFSSHRDLLQIPKWVLRIEINTSKAKRCINIRFFYKVWVAWTIISNHLNLNQNPFNLKKHINNRDIILLRIQTMKKYVLLLSLRKQLNLKNILINPKSKAKISQLHRLRQAMMLDSKT